MSSSLATLADDFLALLTQDIDGNDFISLMLTGNMLLRHKLRLKCSALFFEETPSIAFPFAVFRLPNLRSLSVHGIKEAATYHYFRTGGELAQSVGHKTLQKLQLDFGNATSLFRSPDASLPRLPVRDRFPSLSTLIMNEIKAPWSAETLFGELPETLTTLRVKAVTITLYDAKMDLESIAKLPRHLKSLCLFGFYLTDPPQDDFTILREVLPPNLQHLELQYLDKLTILDYLPSKLKTLCVLGSYGASVFTWKTSKIPSGLIGLIVDKDDWQFEFDAPLPSKLEYMDFHRNSKVIESLTVDDMPLSLKSVDSNWLNSQLNHENLTQDETENLLNRFPNIKSMEVPFGSVTDGVRLPFGIERVIFRSTPRASLPLPSSLTELTLNFPFPLKYFANIPSTIRHVFARYEDDRMRRGEKEPLPLWDAGEFAEFASKVQLESLSVSMECFRDSSCLAPISSMKSLKKLEIVIPGLRDMMQAPQWLPHCLPRDLQTLSLQCWTTPGDDFFSREFSDDFLRLCDLASVTPRLKTLKFRANNLYPAIVGNSFASLPRGLVALDFRFFDADLQPNAFSLLPRSLKYFHIFLKRQHTEHISYRHFRALPESLQEFRFRCGQDDSMMASLPLVFELLPKSIATIQWISTGFYGSQIYEAFAQFGMENRLLYVR